MRLAREYFGATGQSRRGKRPQRGGIFFRLIFLLFLALFVFVIYLVRHPLMRVAGNFWVVDDGPVASDAIVILGDDNYEGDRATRAAEVLKAGWAPRIVASGRYLRPYASVAQLEQHDLLDRGVPASAIVPFPNRATNTREEGEAIGQFISAHGWKRILVVTSNYHSRRARYILARVLPAGTEVRMLAARDTNYDPDNWWRTRRGVKIFFHECVGIVVAMWELRHQVARTSSASLLLAGGEGVGELYLFGTNSHQDRLHHFGRVLYFRSPQTSHALRRVIRASVGEDSYVAQTRRQAIFRHVQWFQFYAV
jgi:uncharacterized SAM-binding protein YcdF (DUF218 family)